MCSFIINNVYIDDYYTLIGKYEQKGLLKEVNFKLNNNYFEEKTFEKAEVKMQKKVLDELLFKNRVDIIIGGDLSNQLAIINKSVQDINIPFLGVYSACSSFIESLIISSLLIDSKKIKKALCLTSSHNSNSEKQFRYPIEYGAPKLKRSTYTATAAVGCVLKNNKTNIKIESVTIGNVVNSTIKDANNMGAVMAPGAFSTIKTHLNDLNREINYYDLILTGDLGKCGQDILKTLLKNNQYYPKKYIDAGMELYSKNQSVNSGASGPAVLPLVFFSNYLKSKYKKILLIGTGSLHSQVLVNQKNEIPCVSHAVSIEVI